MVTVNSPYQSSTASPSVDNMESPLSTVSPLREEDNFTININENFIFDSNMGKIINFVKKLLFNLIVIVYKFNINIYCTYCRNGIRYSRTCYSRTADRQISI